jgi:Cupin
MDVLSTVLKTVQLEGAMFYNAEFSAPKSFRAPPSRLVAPYLSPKPGLVIIYHLLTHGRAYANVEDGQRVALFAGTLSCFHTAIRTSRETVPMSSRWTMPGSFSRPCRKVSS